MSMNESDKFQTWAELAAGHESHQFIPLVDAAVHVGVDVHQFMQAALELKRAGGLPIGSIIWLRGVPWFSTVLAAAIEAKLKAEVIERLQAQAAAMTAAEQRARN